VPEPAIVELSEEQVRAYKPDAPDERDRLIFGSLRIDPVEALSPDAARAASKEEIAAIIVLHALTWNGDLQAEHVLAQEGQDGWRLWAVDHANALAVSDSLAALQGAEAAFQPLQMLAEQVGRGDLEPCVERAKEIAEEDYAEMVRALPAEWIIEPDAEALLARALYERAEALEKVVYVHVP
jgi:hypothetical protein